MGMESIKDDLTCQSTSKYQYGTDCIGMCSLNVWHALVFEDVDNSGIDLFLASFRFQVGNVLFVAIQKGFT